MFPVKFHLAGIYPFAKVIFNAGRAKDAGDKDKRIYPDVCSLLSRLQQRDLDDLLRIIRNRPLRPVGPDISGGKKKVIISLAFSTHTPLLLMDEPTNGLDIPSKEIFRKLLVSFAGEEQTVIISTHQIRDLESLIDAVIILNDKKIILNNTLDEISEKLFFVRQNRMKKSFTEHLRH